MGEDGQALQLWGEELANRCNGEATEPCVYGNQRSEFITADFFVE